MRTFLIAMALLAAACGNQPNVVVTPSPSATPVAASPTPSPTPAPTPLVSARGSIVVKQPLASSRVRNPLTISGDASVFEANLEWQVTDTAGRVLAKGFTTAAAGAPGRGTFTITATYADPPSDAIGFAEVYTRSPRDGQIDEIVRVPLILAGH